MDEVAGSVVVGFDGSSEAEAAVDWAAAEASRLGKPLVVAYGADYSGMLIGVGGMGSWFPEPAQQAAEQIAEEGAQRARKVAGDVEVSALARIHSPAAVLRAASETAALVVVGTRGHGTVAGALLGSVAFAVSASAVCPVVVVRGDSSKPVGPGRPVVVGVDGSSQGEAALDLAADRAADTGAELHLVTAWRTAVGESWAVAYYDANYPGRDPSDVVREAA
ncbi:MAG: universal stress protein, partial [Actinomycetes bacterium]